MLIRLLSLSYWDSVEGWKILLSFSGREGIHFELSWSDALVLFLGNTRGISLNVYIFAKLKVVKFWRIKFAEVFRKEGSDGSSDI